MAEPPGVIVGTVGRAHGLRGEVSVTPRTDFTQERFAPGSRLRTDAGRDLTVAGSRPHPGGLLIRFTGIGDRSAAEELRGTDLWAAGVIEVDADSDDYHDLDLIGLVVVDRAGERLGEVTGVLHLPAQDVLRVRTPQGERLVPFVSALVSRVDLVAGLLEVAPVPGLLDDAAEVAGAD